jgi:hypothetical protein
MHVSQHQFRITYGQLKFLRNVSIIRVARVAIVQNCCWAPIISIFKSQLWGEHQTLCLQPIARRYSQREYRESR